MKREYLVSMCNDIAAFFAIEGEAAAASVAAHLERFWAPSMREQIIGILKAGGEGLSETARAGVAALAARRAA